MSVTNEQPLIPWEVKKILEKRRGGSSQWDKADQRRVYEHADKFYKLDMDDALELLNKLIKEYEIPRVVAVQIVDILPVTLDELDIIFKAIEEISHQARLQKESEIPNYVKEILLFFEKLEKMEKNEKEAFQGELLELVRKYWKKARRLTERSSKEAKEKG